MATGGVEPRPARAPRRARRAQRGAALICSLLCMSLLLALGLSLLLSTTTDTLISNSYRASSEAFFAADGGVAVGRRAVQKALAEQIERVRAKKSYYRPGSQVLPDTGSAPSHEFFTSLEARFSELANDEARSTLENGSRYQVDLVTFEGGPTSPRSDEGLEAYQFLYTIRSLGRSGRGAHAQVEETGRLEFTVKTSSTKPTREPFSKFGTFFDVGADGGMVLVSGVFTGPVHTNSRFAFSSKHTVKFTGAVTQVDGQIEYDGRSAPIPEGGVDGILVSDGAYRQSDRVPKPANNYSQEMSVLNPGGEDDPERFPTDANGRPAPEAFAQNLIDARGNNPTPQGSRLPNGVYVASSDVGTSATGGIYVQGDADIQLSASGDAQVIQVTQGGRTTTVTINYAAPGTTTIASAGGSYTLQGVPNDPDWSRPGLSVFVNGSVTSLSGPPASNGVTPPALSPRTAMTVTAQRHVRITGDLKYPEPIVNPNGTPAPGATESKAVLGIFTNDGNVELAPDPTRVDGGGASLEIDAAIVCFDANAGNNGGAKEGMIFFDGPNTPGPKDKLTIVGSRVQARIGNIGYKNRAVFFDPRFEDGDFAPPFFPGTGVIKKPGEFGFTFPGEQAIQLFADSWQRDERRRRREE